MQNWVGQSLWTTAGVIMLVKDIVSLIFTFPKLESLDKATYWTDAIDPLLTIWSTIIIAVGDACYMAGDVPGEQSIKEDASRRASAPKDWLYADQSIKFDAIYYPGDTLANIGSILCAQGAFLEWMGKQLMESEDSAVKALGDGLVLFGKMAKTSAFQSTFWGGNLQIAAYSYQIWATKQYCS